MKSKIVVLVLIVAVGALCYLALRDKPSGITIGIIQTASHPALDRAREGFKAQLTEQLPGVQFIEQNAEGIAAQAQSIAAALHANKNVIAIFAIGTLAAQATAAIEKQKPIIITAVTDPKGSGLIQSNLTGTSDRIEAAKHVELIKQLIPTAEKVALLYTLGEANSAAAVSEMQTALARQDVQAILVGVHQASDVVTATLYAANKADVIWVPSDNLLVSAMPTVARVARENKKALIVSDPPSVERGALACVGVDYMKAGAKSAKIAAQILKDKVSPSTISIHEEQNPPKHVNHKLAEELGIEVHND